MGLMIRNTLHNIFDLWEYAASVFTPRAKGKRLINYHCEKHCFTHQQII